MLLLENPIQPYAWGPIDGLAPLVGSDPTGGPEAELWVGTHPAAPSRLAGDPDGRTLDDLVASDPKRWLGTELAAAGHTALPFLLKVLAIGSPLSLQAHPSAEQAAAGFAREEAAGLALDAPNRTYRDAGPKPEALVALVPTWALCGFRPAVDAAALVADLRQPALDPLVQRLEAKAIEDAFSWLLSLTDAGRAEVSGALREALGSVSGAASHGAPSGDGAPDAADLADPASAVAARWWAARLVGEHPGDPAAVAPFLLNVVRLDPGHAVHLPAGNLHAYLHGAGIEIMAASDNVLRGGLTPKHVDRAELLKVVRFVEGLPATPTRTSDDGVTTYDAGEAAFALAVVDPAVAPDPPHVLDTGRGPAVLLATGGPVDVATAESGLSLGHGDAAFVAPGEGPVHVSGPGRLWCATPGRPADA